MMRPHPDFAATLAILAAVAAVLAHPAQAAKPARTAAADKVATLETAAFEAFQAGDFARAADFYLRLYTEDPAKPQALYNAAVAEDKAGLLDPAIRHYQEFLGVAPDAHEKRAAAKTRLDAALARRPPSAAASSPPSSLPAAATGADAAATTVGGSATPAAVVARAEPVGAPTAAWLAVLGGGLAVAAGGVVYGLAYADRADLEADWAPGKIRK